MIILKHISLEHFMSLDHLDLDFPENCMIAITGENGAGKSSLLYALAFCITNFKKGEKFEHYIQTGHNLARINLQAYLRGFPISYEIEIPRPTGKTTSLPVKRVITYKGKTYLNNDYIQFMKEFELDYIESMMFLFQGTNSIINSRPAERADTLKRLFNFQFTEIVNKLRAKQEQNKQINLETNAVLTELKTRTFEQQRLFRCSPQSVIESWEQELQETERTLTQLQAVDKTVFDQVLVHLQENEDARKRSTAHISQLEQSLAANRQRIEGLEAELAEETEEQLDRRITEQAQAVEEHQKSYLLQKQTAVEFQNSLNLKNYELQQLLKQLEISKTGVCHACGQTIEESYVQQLEQKKDKADQEARKIREDISTMNFDPDNKTGKTLEKELKALEKQKTLRKQKEQELGSLQNYHKVWTDSLMTEQTHYQTLLNQRHTLEMERDQLAKFQEVYARKDSLEEKRADLQQKIQAAKTMQIQNAERRRLNETIDKERAERDHKLLELSEKMNKTLLQMTTTKASIDIFENQFPNFLVLKAAQMLEDHINLIIQKVFPEMQVKLQSQRGGVNFFYKVSEDEEWLSIAMASGAQSQILTLAYMISLSRLSGIDCLLMDEIDASLSEENAAIIYNFIAGLDCFKQVIFISHKKEAIPATREINPNILAYYVNNGEYTLLD